MIKKYVIAIIIIFAIGKYGIGYFASEDFQKYGDDKKAQWTCHVNGFLAEFNIIMSDYERSLYYYRHIVKRCPKTPIAVKADYKIAYCYQKLKNFGLAISTYQRFSEKYPKHELSKKIPRRIQRLEEMK